MGGSIKYGPTQRDHIDCRERMTIPSVGDLSWTILDYFRRSRVMRKVSAHEARTHLPRLLKRVGKGERFVITKHGRPIAELVPVQKRFKERIEAAIEGLKAFQASHSLGGLSVREMIEEGQKY